MPRTGVLGVVEAPYRGALERGYADCFYLARVLAAQLGGLDLLLRGEAVLLARAARATRDEGRWDPDLAAYARDTGRVLVDADAVARLGLDPADLLPEVRPVPAGGTAEWLRYPAVWFL